MIKINTSTVFKSDYIIPLILFVSAFFIYDFNLEGQPWHGDEITYLGWGGNYIHLLTNGKFNDPCLISLDRCNGLFHIPAFGLTYSPLRNMLIGIPMYFENQTSGNFYNWSCYWDCYDHKDAPTIQEMTSGRLFSPVFGSLTIVLSFFIGKMLFNRTVGIFVSLLFLFYDLWIWYSRVIMVEVHYVFFLLLSISLLLYSVKTQRLKITYFILSALIFGIALNSKMLAVSFSGLFFCIILFSNISHKKTNSIITDYKVRTLLMIVSFFSITFVGLFLAEPGFYQNPWNEIKTMKIDMDNYNHDVWYIGYPTTQNLQLKSTITILHFIVFPSFIEKQVSNPSLSLGGNLGWTFPPTYSSIPVTLFFIIGFGYAIYKIKKSKNLVSNEMLLIVWFISTFVLTLVIVKDFSLERYLLPLEITVLFIASYGFWNFIQGIQNNKLKLGFSTFFIAVHSMVSLSYWGKIYFSPGTTWVNPLHYGTLQQSLDNSYVLIANLIFLCFFLYMLVFKFQKIRHACSLDPR